MKIFLACALADDEFARQVRYYLDQQPNVETFLYTASAKTGPWPRQCAEELESSNRFIVFVGQSPDGDAVHVAETQAWSLSNHLENDRAFVVLPDADIPDALKPFAAGIPEIRVDRFDQHPALECSKAVIDWFGMTWFPPDGVPSGYVFDYEKDVIEAFVKGSGKLGERHLKRGCPPLWPTVEFNPSLIEQRANPLPTEKIGEFRRADAQIAVDGRVHDDPVIRKLTFPEAGPRATLRCRPHQAQLNVAILVSGGIAPGINAVISGIADRHQLYSEAFRQAGVMHHVSVWGYPQGFKALLHPGQNRRQLNEEEVARESTRAGSMVSTARADDLLAASPEVLARAVQRLQDDAIDILYVIGGDGSMRAAHAIGNIAQQENTGLSVVGIPKTMDNDILWVWQSFGFMSAVERARESIIQLHTEAKSNPRLCVLQLFGSDSGFVVSHAALGSGVVDLALIPEMAFSMQHVSDYVRNRLIQRRQHGENPHAVVVMAETAIPEDVEQYLRDPDVGLTPGERKEIEKFVKRGRRVHGQTPDALRSGGLKVVARVLQKSVRSTPDTHKYWKTFRVFTNEPRHLIRSMRPSVSDVIHAQRLGTLAVDNAMAGFTDFMVSQWLTEYVLVPLKLVVVGRKRVPLPGIFWKSVLANTGQPPELSAKPADDDEEGGAEMAEAT